MAREALLCRSAADSEPNNRPARPYDQGTTLLLSCGTFAKQSTLALLIKGVFPGRSDLPRLFLVSQQLLRVSLLHIGHVMPGHVTPRDLSYYHRPCGAAQHVSNTTLVRAQCQGSAP